VSSLTGQLVPGHFNTIASAPYLWREREAGYRRVNCPIFPYYVAYVIRDGVIVVVAVVVSQITGTND